MYTYIYNHTHTRQRHIYTHTHTHTHTNTNTHTHTITYTHTHTHTIAYTHTHTHTHTHESWPLMKPWKYRSLLQNIGPFCRALLQTRPIFLSSVAAASAPQSGYVNTYMYVYTCVRVCIFILYELFCLALMNLVFFTSFHVKVPL